VTNHSLFEAYKIRELLRTINVRALFIYVNLEGVHNTANLKEDNSVNIVVWNEYRHEKSNEVVAAIYPEGIHAVIAQAGSVKG
jgi:hypothetical protein